MMDEVQKSPIYRVNHLDSEEAKQTHMTPMVVVLWFDRQNSSSENIFSNY